ncbi:Fic family protein [Hymenobacter sp. NST-14]|uniref:Fic/DOC family protein n=1 Tax=Hymenobacter piscis TaxID=2839984 RepID=UPI001C02EC52|nr:Fic family protein [Hymenobacter piscis]MBT9394442.1 Fic family protein [Hymenobacter piscis]
MNLDYNRYGNTLPENKVGADSAEQLARAERIAGDFRRMQLETGLVEVKGSLDTQHLKQLHTHVMKDVYDWAGQTRQEQQHERERLSGDVQRGRIETISYAPAAEVSARLDTLSNQLKGENMLRGNTPENFAGRAAHYFDQLNYIQPFRAGNEQTLMAGMTVLAKQAGYDLKFDQIKPEDLRRAGDEALRNVGESKAGPGAEQSRLRELTSLFERATVPLPGVQAEAARHPVMRGPAQDPPELRQQMFDAQRTVQQHGRNVVDNYAIIGMQGDVPRAKVEDTYRALFHASRGELVQAGAPLLKEAATYVEKNNPFPVEGPQPLRQAIRKLEELQPAFESERNRNTFVQASAKVENALWGSGSRMEAQEVRRAADTVSSGQNLSPAQVTRLDGAMQTAYQVASKSGDQETRSALQEMGRSSQQLLQPKPVTREGPAVTREIDRER